MELPIPMISDLPAKRSKKRSPEVIAKLKADVRASVLADHSLKTTGIVLGISKSTACHWAIVLGFRRMFVTPEERAHLMARRTAPHIARQPLT